MQRCLRTLVPACCALLLAPSLARADCGGAAASRSYQPELAHSLRISGNAQVFISQGDVAALRIEAKQEVLDDLEIALAQRIRIKPDDCDDAAYTVRVTLVGVQALEFSGSPEVTALTPLTGERIEVAASGASDATLELDTGRLLIDVSGSTDLTLSGRAALVTVHASGSTRIKATDLVADEYDVDASGSSRLDVHVNNSLDADLSGSSRIGYRGTPRMDVETSGSSRIKPL